MALYKAYMKSSQQKVWYKYFLWAVHLKGFSFSCVALFCVLPSAQQFHPFNNYSFTFQLKTLNLVAFNIVFSTFKKFIIFAPRHLDMFYSKAGPYSVY
jgi:hypothetical protein